MSGHLLLSACIKTNVIISLYGIDNCFAWNYTLRGVTCKTKNHWKRTLEIITKHIILKLAYMYISVYALSTGQLIPIVTVRVYKHNCADTSWSHNRGIFMPYLEEYNPWSIVCCIHLEWDMVSKSKTNYNITISKLLLHRGLKVMYIDVFLWIYEKNCSF